MKRSVIVYLIVIIMLIISLAAIIAGFKLINDPTGKSLQFPDNFLKDSAFHNYLIPGIILFSFIGLFPLVLIFGLIKRKSLVFLNNLKIYKDESWQFNFLIYYGLMLIIWINVQSIFVPYFFLQTVVSCTGVLVIFLSIFLRKYF